MLLLNSNGQTSMRRSNSMSPLPALRAFEAAGRLLNFRRAGEELLISQSAISHHIKLLEEFIGQSVFLRRARQVRLTEAGAAYHAIVTAAFDTLRCGTSEASRPIRSSTVRVSLLPSFAANWMVRRLPDFTARHPDIRVELDPTLVIANMQSGNVDLAIRYDAGGWEGSMAEAFLAESLTPIASPALIKIAKLVGPNDMLEHPLLLTRNADDWQAWGKLAGVNLTHANTIQLVDYNIVIQAAEEGRGIALGRRTLLQDKLGNGTLVELWPDLILKNAAAYWLVENDKKKRTPAAQKFYDWLKETPDHEVLIR